MPCGWGGSADPSRRIRTERLTPVARAAGDRIKTAGDILDYPEFFYTADQLQWDAKDFDKRIRQAEAGPLLTRLRPQLAAVDPSPRPRRSGWSSSSWKTKG